MIIMGMLPRWLGTLYTVDAVLASADRQMPARLT